MSALTQHTSLRKHCSPTALNSTLPQSAQTWPAPTAPLNSHAALTTRLAHITSTLQPVARMPCSTTLPAADLKEGASMRPKSHPTYSLACQAAAYLRMSPPSRPTTQQDQSHFPN